MERRVAIVDKSKCVIKTTCPFICGKNCPVNAAGEPCIYLGEDGYPVIEEVLCTGCGICPKRCPTGAISIVNLPKALDEEPIHSYGINSFRLFRLPIPKFGKVIGILGRNGSGKSTAFDILTSNIKPNLGDYEKGAKNEDIIKKYSKTILGDFFKKLYGNKIKIAYKPQRVELISKSYNGKVGELLSRVDERKVIDRLGKEFGIENIKDRYIKDISGGELQKVAILATAARDADIYFFDEPASFLDITTRIKAAKLISSLKSENKAVIVVEHDLATLDYISDEMQIFYGEAACYGIVSQSKAVRRGINEYLDGYLPDENIRFRDYPIIFYRSADRFVQLNTPLFSFPSMTKTFENFELKINKGTVRKGEVLTVMGANGLGKTTFLKILAGIEKPDNCKIEKLNLAYKPQQLKASSKTVREALLEIAGSEFETGWYKQNILEKLGLKNLLEQKLNNLSGGELQKVNIAITLSSDANIFAFDEPSAFIDVEDRLNVAEVIKEFVIKKDVCAIVVDHDVQFVDYIGDSMLIFNGIPGKSGEVTGPFGKIDGMNEVLKILDITYRMEKETGRPRINKPGSVLDREQRSKGKYYYN